MSKPYPQKWRKAALEPDGSGPLPFRRAVLGPLDRVGPDPKFPKAPLPTRYRE